MAGAPGVIPGSALALHRHRWPLEDAGVDPPSSLKPPNRLHLALLLACLPALAVLPSRAQGPSQAAGAGAHRMEFRIPAQPLGEALLAFSRQSGLQLAAVGEFGVDRRSVAVAGVMRPDEALRRLMGNSPFRHEIVRDMVIVSALRADAPTPGTRPAPVVSRQVEPSTLSTIVVTARRRDERWIDVPMGLSVTTGEQIDALGLENVSEALRLSPGVASVDTGAAFTQVQIRGVSSSLGGNDNGYYIDDVPFTGVTVPWHPDTRSFDLDRIEVLKGPQGTLFGEGSMGGSVRIMTRAPELGRFAMATELGMASTDGGGDGWSGKLMANLPLLQDRVALRLVNTNESLPGWVDDIDGSRNINAQQVRTTRARLRWSGSDRWTTDFSHMRSRTDAAGGGYSADDELRSNVHLSTLARWRANSVTSSLDMDASRWLLVWSNAQLSYFNDGLITPDTHLLADILIDVETAELRWSSSGDGPWNWVAGYAHRVTGRRDTLQLEDISAGAKQSNRADTLFGEATLSAPDRAWSVTAGLRYFRDEVDTLALSRDEVFQTRATFPRFNPKLGVTRRLSANRTLYASSSSGFRSGQLQPAESMLAASDAGVELARVITPDTIVSHEVGIKQMLLDGQLLLQGAVFHSRWRDLPVRVPINDTTNGLANAPGAVMTGIEFGVSYAPLNELKLELGGTWLRAVYSADVPQTGLRDGTPIYNVPRFTLGGSARYAWPVRERWKGVVATSASYHSERETALVVGESGDAILSANLRLGLESAQGWGWYLYCENIGNTLGALDGRTAFWNATRMRPRTYGVEFRYAY